MIATRSDRAAFRPAVGLGPILVVLGSSALGWGSDAMVGAEPGRVVAPATAPSAPLKWIRRGGLPERVTTQHHVSLAAQAIHPGSTASAAGSASAPAGAVLRWRTPDAAQTQPARGSRLEPTRLATVAEVPRNSYPVRQVSATDQDLPAAIPDVFADPFGDRPRRSAAPAPASRRAEPQVELTPAQTASLTVADTPGEDDPPPQPLLEAVPQPLPPPPSQSSLEDAQEDKPACTRTYNRRDCCAEDKQCAHARDSWRHDAISKFGLDISPSMHPDQLDPGLEEEARSRDLAESPVRTWRDRQGQVLATGRLHQVQRGKVLVLDAQNQIARLPYNDLSDDDLCFLTAWWRVPAECTFGEEQFAGRNWAPSTLTWKASALCHKPLYFEQVQLERYGHTAGPIKQPLLSGAHFFTSLVTLPYQAGINPPWECRYALGYYRPGSCAPWLVPPIPLSVRGGLWQAGAVVGGVALFP